MKEYAKRDYVKARAHERYIDKKIEDAQLDTSNDNLHAINSERFINEA